MDHSLEGPLVYQPACMESGRAHTPDACDELTQNGGLLLALAARSALACHVSDTRGKGIGVSGHHITGASPDDDIQAEDTQYCFLCTGPSTKSTSEHRGAGLACNVVRTRPDSIIPHHPGLEYLAHGFDARDFHCAHHT